MEGIASFGVPCEAPRSTNPVDFHTAFVALLVVDPMFKYHADFHLKSRHGFINYVYIHDSISNLIIFSYLCTIIYSIIIDDLFSREIPNVSFSLCHIYLALYRPASPPILDGKWREYTVQLPPFI